MSREKLATGKFGTKPRHGPATPRYRMERDGPAPGTFRKYVRRRRPWLNSQSHPLLRTAGTPMPDASPIPIFDGHNDMLLRLLRKGAAAVQRHFTAGTSDGHPDLPGLTAGGIAAGAFAVFVTS